MPGLKELGKIHTVSKPEQLKSMFAVHEKKKGSKQHFTLYPQAVGAKKKGGE